MKFLIVSDTHGDVTALDELVKRYRAGVDLVIHLGDHLVDFNEVMRDFPTRAGIGVLGNCDFASMYLNARYEGSFSAEERRIFYSHGHKYNVKYGSEYIVSNAKLNKCDIVLYGHTHVRACEELNGVLVINPGSLSRPRDGERGSYAILTVNGKNASCEILEV